MLGVKWKVPTNGPRGVDLFSPVCHTVDKCYTDGARPPVLDSGWHLSMGCGWTKIDLTPVETRCIAIVFNG